MKIKHLAIRIIANVRHEAAGGEEVGGATYKSRDFSSLSSETGQTMETGGASELHLFFLLTAALCLQATVIKSSVHCPARTLDWAGARSFCQKNFIDLVTWDRVEPQWSAGFLMNTQAQNLWIGLHRDPENGSVWRWVDVK